MGIADVSILSMLRTRMQWHQERQRVLADNIANAETPNFVPHDLAEPRFDARFDGGNLSPISLVRTDPGHQGDPESASLFGQTTNGFQIRPAGNGVTHESEMIKVADNQMNFQAATALYTKSLGLIKTAVGKK